MTTVLPSYSHLYAPYSLPTITGSTDKIRHKVYKTKQHPEVDYVVLNYDPQYMCIDEPIETRQFRSVILSHPEEELLSFSPPKSITKSQFYERYPNILPEDLQITETMEGIMIHLFYDKRISAWQIATKSAVGGQYFLFDKTTELKHKDTSVYHMFLDALELARDSSHDTLSIKLESFPRFYSYSFVLQHPENRIVLSIKTPALYLVAVYDIMPVSMSLLSIPQFVYQRFLCFSDVSAIRFPELYDCNRYFYLDLEQQCESIQNTSRTVGLTYTHLPSGTRCNIRNPVYVDVYRVRYLATDIQYQYLCLRHIGRVSNFLSFFPEYKGDFYRFYEQTTAFLDNIHASYMSFYVLKEGIPVSLKYWTYVRRLHKELYIPSLSSGREIRITRPVVYEFMKQFSPEDWLYALNYEQRNLG
jgi:hypothetical protein